MNRQFWIVASLALIASGVLQACSGAEVPQAETSGNEPSDLAETDGAATVEGSESGTLQFRANGEDFVRQGFVTKDGWQISFDHVYVNLADLTAYQTDPPYDPEAGTELQAQQEVGLSGVKTVDLAEGNESADPILIEEVSAPAGQYNALSWKMEPTSDGPAAGSTLMLVGTAQKDGESLPFTIRLDPEYFYTCGEFVGDERKGILAAGETSELEATFHFDHLFGDGDAPADDAINTGALGFDPLAALAVDGQVDVDMATLKEELSPADYSTLEDAISGLGHVGEGHCTEVSGNHAHE